MKLDPVATTSPSTARDKPPTNISDDVSTDSSAYYTATSRSSSDDYNHRQAPSAHIRKYRPYMYRGTKKRRVDQPSKASGVAVMRPAKKIFGNAVESQRKSFIERSSRYDIGVVNVLKKMTEKTAAQMKDQTLSSLDPCRLSSSSGISERSVMASTFMGVQLFLSSTATYRVRSKL